MTAKSSARDTLSRMRAAATGAKPEPTAPSAPVATASSEAVPPSPRQQRKTTMRYTIDLAPEERRSLRTFAIDHDTDASVIIKAFIGLLRDPLVSERILDEVQARSRELPV